MEVPLYKSLSDLLAVVLIGVSLVILLVTNIESISGVPEGLINLPVRGF